MVAVAEEPYPGQRLGLPADGRGSLSTWRLRIGALLIDWGTCMVVAIAIFGQGVLTGGGWRAWMILATFFIQSTVLCWLAGGSFGQLVCRIAVVRLDRQPLGLVRACSGRRWSAWRYQRWSLVRTDAGCRTWPPALQC